MTTAAAGRIGIAHWGGACVSWHGPASGAELGDATLPASHITNCVLGGHDMRTLFITCARDGLSAEQLARDPLAGGLFAVELDESGLPASLFGG
ncbi:MAG: SMP-30/gluconolactonase/LRE family protein [Rhizobacter sp.]|nr:SMP-30/gluconolactonase/LRE family protein [Rhizobacter sp.]